MGNFPTNTRSAEVERWIYYDTFIQLWRQNSIIDALRSFLMEQIEDQIVLDPSCFLLIHLVATTTTTTNSSEQEVKNIRTLEHVNHYPYVLKHLKEWMMKTLINQKKECSSSSSTRNNNKAFAMLMSTINHIFPVTFRCINHQKNIEKEFGKKQQQSEKYVFEIGIADTNPETKNIISICLTLLQSADEECFRILTEHYDIVTVLYAENLQFVTNAPNCTNNAKTYNYLIDNMVYKTNMTNMTDNASLGMIACQFITIVSLIWMAEYFRQTTQTRKNNSEHHQIEFLIWNRCIIIAKQFFLQQLTGEEEHLYFHKRIDGYYLLQKLEEWFDNIKTTTTSSCHFYPTQVIHNNNAFVLISQTDLKNARNVLNKTDTMATTNDDKDDKDTDDDDHKEISLNSNTNKIYIYENLPTLMDIKRIRELCKKTPVRSKLIPPPLMMIDNEDTDDEKLLSLSTCVALDVYLEFEFTRAASTMMLLGDDDNISHHNKKRKLYPYKVNLDLYILDEFPESFAYERLKLLTHYGIFKVTTEKDYVKIMKSRGVKSDDPRYHKLLSTFRKRTHLNESVIESFFTESSSMSMSSSLLLSEKHKFIIDEIAPILTKFQLPQIIHDEEMQMHKSRVDCIISGQKLYQMYIVIVDENNEKVDDDSNNDYNKISKTTVMPYHKWLEENNLVRNSNYIPMMTAYICRNTDLRNQSSRNLYSSTTNTGKCFTFPYHISVYKIYSETDFIHIQESVNSYSRIVDKNFMLQKFTVNELILISTNDSNNIKYMPEILYKNKISL